VLCKYFAIPNLHEKRIFLCYAFGNHRIFLNFDKNEIHYMTKIYSLLFTLFFISSFFAQDNIVIYLDGQSTDLSSGSGPHMVAAPLMRQILKNGELLDHTYLFQQAGQTVYVGGMQPIRLAVLVTQVLK